MIDKFTMNVDNNSLVMVVGSPEYVLSIKSARYKLFIHFQISIKLYIQ